MLEHKRPTQVQRVLDYMRDFGGITQHQASLDLGVQRLASRISEIKKMGIHVTSEFVPVQNRYGETCHIKRYKLEEQ